MWLSRLRWGHVTGSANQRRGNVAAWVGGANEKGESLSRDPVLVVIGNDQGGGVCIGLV